MKTNVPYCVVIICVVSLLSARLSAQNLVTNSGFSSGFTGWSTNCTYELNSEAVYGGSSSTNMTTEIDVERCINQQICILSGTTYTVSFKGSRRTSGTVPASPGITIKVTGVSSGTQYINVNKTYSNTTFAFTTQTYSFTVPANSTDKKVNIEFLHYNNTTTFGVILDDIELYPSNTFSINGTVAPTYNINSTYKVDNVPSSGVVYNWNFVDNATPLTSTAAAPSVKWSTKGPRTITVALGNGSCSVTTLSKAIVVAGPLPVTLTDFRATNSNSNVQLSWTTQQENNNRHFVIERSSDGYRFDSIGIIAGTNTAIAHSYVFTDKNTVSGTSHYRLRQVDYDNATLLSAIVTVSARNSDNTTVQLYPNPAHEVLYCNFTNSRGGTVTVQVASAAGTVVWQQQKEYSAGSNKAVIATQSLTRGIYYLKIADASGQQTVRTFSVL